MLFAKGYLMDHLHSEHQASTCPADHWNRSIDQWLENLTVAIVEVHLLITLPTLPITLAIGFISTPVRA